MASPKILKLFIAALLLVAIAACGGGGSSSSPSATNNPENTTENDEDTQNSQKSWQMVDTITFPHRGGFLNFASLNRPDGSKLVVFPGSGDIDCNDTDIGAVSITGDTLRKETELLNTTETIIGARDMVAADFNSDGFEDFFVANQGCDKPPFDGEENTLFVSDGYEFEDRTSSLPSYNMFTHSTDAADVRLKGYPDILIGVLGSENIDGQLVGPYFLRNNGEGSFTTDFDSLAPEVADGSYQFTYSRLVDINNDNLPDLILGADQEATAGAVYFNDGTGKFDTAKFEFPVGLYGVNNTVTVDITAHDFNDDGYDDLLLSQVPNAPVFYENSLLQILISDGSGGFSDETNAYIPDQEKSNAWVEFTHIVDINEDGCPDILNQMTFPFPGDAVAYVCDGGTYVEATEAQLPSSTKALIPANFTDRNVILSSRTDGQGNGIMEMFEYK